MRVKLFSGPEHGIPDLELAVAEWFDANIKKIEPARHQVSAGDSGRIVIAIWYSEIG